MKTMDPHIQRIIDWRENFATLPDNHFFELIRMYIGEVHTPYNKPKLIEELGAFLRKEENRKTLVSLLSESDIQILSAVFFIPCATQEKLALFFAGTFNFANVYERLLNLEERLILYRHGDKKSGKIVISINPMLEDILQPFLKREVLLPPSCLAKRNDGVTDLLSGELIASFISFVYSNPDFCKTDGSFKKRSAGELEKKFPGKLELLQTLADAMRNLGLLRESENAYLPDMARLHLFAQLPPKVQYAYLCVSAQGRFSRTALVRQAQLLLKVGEEMGGAGLNRESLLRLAFLISEKDNDVPGLATLGETSRFSAMLERAHGEENSEPVGEGVPTAASTLDRLIDSALALGIFSILGEDENGKAIFGLNPAFWDLKDSNDESADFPKVLLIDAAFSVTLMPGLPLSKLLELVSVMDLVRFDRAAVFEISRKSVMRAFDEGMNQKELISLLSSLCPFELPQNLLVSIEDWSRSYSSASLFKGYVLKVDEENIVYTEKNPIIAPHIVTTLAPGVYLLSVQSDEEAEKLITRSGLDFIGKIKSAGKPVQSLGFPRLYLEERVSAPQLEDDEKEKSLSTPVSLSSEEERAAHFDAMREELEKLSMTPEQKDGLLHRIQHKIILNSSQLRSDSVRLEKIEAGGMDYNGKVHVIEGAITSNSIIELEYDDPSSPDGSLIVMGTPLALEKLENDTLVRLRMEPSKTEEMHSVGKARFLKRVRGSVLK